MTKGLKYKHYRYCFVPGCSSTSIQTPGKRFICVPRNEKVRKKWLTVCKRYDGSMKSNFYCCEDHFDVDEDFDNVVQHKLTGRPLRLKNGVLPSKFDCQRGKMCSYFALKALETSKHSKGMMKRSNPSEKDRNSLVLAHSQSQTKTVSKKLALALTSHSETLDEKEKLVPNAAAHENLIKVKEEPVDDEGEKQAQISKVNVVKLEKADVEINAARSPSINQKLQSQSSVTFLSNGSNKLQSLLKNQTATRFLSNASNIIGIQTVRPIGIIAANIQVPVLQKQPMKVHVPSSLPASENWPGEYGFTVSFTEVQRSSKTFTWTYSKIRAKLYVNKDASCPINFSTNKPLPSDVFIRATALYSSPDTEVVRRCINHSTDDLNKGLVEAEHLVRCECRSARYYTDPSTHRHSVVVPFENPPVGQRFSTYIYKFTCFGSCTGGPNRRPLMIVFTLEKDNKVIGRQRLDVKICACPGRDQKFEEYLLTGLEEPVKEKSEFVNLSDSMEFVKNVAFPLPKKVKLSPSNEGLYTIKTDNLNCFEFLKQMETFYKICKTMTSIPPDITSSLMNYQQQQIKTEE